MNASILILITEASQVGEARRSISALAVDVGLSETIRGQLAIIVTELGNNLVKHTRGKGGHLIFRVLSPDEGLGLEILSLDQGPGMVDVSRCMSDGFSTAGSPGTGLGAASRLSSFFDIYSLISVGTAILSKVISQPHPLSPSSSTSLEMGAICLPYPGEMVSGDALEAKLWGDSGSLLIVDGLGHGLLAHKAAQEAVRSFRDQPASSSAKTLESIHLALKNTRGAAVATAQIDPEAALIHYAGLGNTVGIVFSATGEQRRMVSHNGTAGIQIKRIQEFDYPWGQGSVLVLHSDGLATHWSLNKYPGLLARHPALIAGVLYRDFNRGRDDVSILVVSSRKKLFSWKRAAS